MKPVVPAAFHNRVLQAAQEKSLLLEDKLVAVLIPVLTEVANQAAENFTRVATKSLIASARRDADMRILGQLGPVASRSLVASLGLSASVAPNSTMIAVKPTAEQAEALAMAHPEATEPDDLHVTLAFLGHFDGDLQEIADALRPVANAHAPLEGKVGGVGRFADNGKGAPAIVLPSVPGLVELRVAVTQALVDSNLDYGREHGYQPHMTILYDKDGQTLPAQDSMNQPLTFNELLIVRGNLEQVALPLTGAKPLTAAASSTATLPDPFRPPDVPDPVRSLLSAQEATADEALQSAQSQLDVAQEHLSNAVHDGDAVAMAKAQKEVERARQNYNRALQSARNAKKKFDSLVPVVVGNPDQTPSGQPSGQVTPPSEKVKSVSDATDKTTEQIDEEKKARRDAAARARADGRAGDSLNQEATAPTEGDFSTGANVGEGIDLTGGDLAAERANLAQIAAQSFAAWPPPVSSEVIDVAALEEVLHQKMGAVTDAAAHNVIQAAISGSGIPNLAFDITNPLAGRVLARSASQIVNISQTTQADVMAVIKDAHDSGLSIPATADLIRSKMIEATPARATLIARTELAGAVNGGSLAATQIVAKASGDNYTKQWLTAPGAHYPRHEDYPGLDQQTAPLDGTFVVGDSDLQFPGDPDGPPEEVCNCRCTLVYIQGAVPYTNDVASTAPPPETPPEPQPLPVDDGTQPSWSNPALNDLPLIKKEAFPGEDRLPANIRQELALGKTSPIVDVSKEWAPSDAQAEADGALPKLKYLQGLSAHLPPPKYDGQMSALYIWQTPEGDARIEAALRSGKPLDSIYLDKRAMPPGADLAPVADQLNAKGLKVTYNKESQRVMIDAKQMAQGLDDSIAAAPSIDHPITVYRGMQTSSGLFGADGPTVGEIVTDKGYQASTILPEAARNYADPTHTNVKAAKGTTGNPTVLQIALPKGQHGFLMQWSKGEDENFEYLLPRGMSYQVDKVEKVYPTPSQPGYDLVNVHVVPTPGTLPPEAAADLAKGVTSPTIVNEATSGEIAGIPGSQADLGITPFVGPRGDQPGDNPIGFYDSAKFQQFTKDMYSIAPEYGVTVDGFDRVEGVWSGGSEPSIALHAHDGVVAMRAYAARLGKLYDQEGVVIFDNVSSQGDMLATFRKSYKPEEYDGVVKDMADSGLYGGRFTVDGKFQVSGGGPDFVDSVNKLSDTLGVGYDAQHGGFTLLEDQPAPDSIGISYQQVTDTYAEAGHAGEAGGFAPVPVDSAGTDDGVLRAEPGGAGGVEAAAQTASADPAGAVADLPGLAAEARKSPSFQDFENDFIVQGKQGVYYHVTGQKNFTIDPEKGPTDASTLSEGATEKGALMVTSDLENWLTQMPGRHYVAKIDMSAVPADAYKQVNRGFGNEFFVTDPSLAKVETVMTRGQARIDSEAQAALLAKRIEGPEDLQAFYTAANAPESLPAVVAEDLAKGAVAPEIVDEAKGFEQFGPLPGAVAPKFKLVSPGVYDTEDGRLTLYRLEGVSPPAWNVEWTVDYENALNQATAMPAHAVLVDGAASKKDALELFVEHWPETRAQILGFEQAPLTATDVAAQAEEVAKMGQNPFDALADLHETLPPRTDAAIAEAAGSPAKDTATIVKPNPEGSTVPPDFQQMKMLSTSATPDAKALDKKFAEGLPLTGGYVGPDAASQALDEWDNRAAAKQIIATDLSKRLAGNPVWDSYVREGTTTLKDSGLQVGDIWHGSDGDFVVTKLPHDNDGEFFKMKPLDGNADWYDSMYPDKEYDFEDTTPFSSQQYAPLTGAGETPSVQAAAGLVDNWAGTASDSNPWALALQQAAEKEFGLPDGSFERALHDSDVSSQGQAYHIFQAHGPALQAFVRAQYDATQEWLKLNFPGQDKLILYRGQGIGGVHAGALDTGTIDTAELDLQPMSSFSYTADTALDFVPAGSESAMMGMEVPFDRIMATARTGFGCLNENEFVVLGEPGGVTDTATVVTGRFSEIQDAAFRGRRDDRDNAFWEHAYNQEAIRTGPEPPTGNSFAYRRPDTSVATAFKITSDVNADGMREITDVQTGEKIMVPAQAVKAAAYTNDVSGGKALDYSQVEKVEPLEDALLDYGAKVKADVIANPLTEGGLPKVGAIFEHPTMPADADGYRAIGQWRVIKVNEDGTTLVRNMNEGTEYKIPTQDVATALKVNPVGTLEEGDMKYQAVTPIASIEKAITPPPPIGTQMAKGVQLQVGDQYQYGGSTWTVTKEATPTESGVATILHEDGTVQANISFKPDGNYPKIVPAEKPPLAEAAPTGDELVGKHFYGADDGNEYKIVSTTKESVTGEDLNGHQVVLTQAAAANKVAEWDAANASTAAELVGKHLTYVGKEFEVVEKIGPKVKVKLLNTGDQFEGETYDIGIDAAKKGIEEYEQKLAQPPDLSSSLPAGALVNGSELSVGDLINHEGTMWKVQEVPTPSYKGVAVPVNTDTGNPTNSTTTLLLNKDNSYEKAQLFDPDTVAAGVKKGDSFQHVKKDGTVELYNVTGKGLDADSVQVQNVATGAQWVVPAKPVAWEVASYKEPGAPSPNTKLQEHLG